MTIRLMAIAAQTTYGATLYLGNAQAGARLPLAEAVAGQYEATPVGLAAGIYTVVFDNNGDEVARIIYEWNGSQEVTNSLIAEAVESVSQSVSNINTPGSATTISATRNTTSSIKVQC